MSYVLGERYRPRANPKTVYIVTRVEPKTIVTVESEDRNHYPKVDMLDAVTFGLLYELVPQEEETDGAA